MDSELSKRESEPAEGARTKSSNSGAASVSPPPTSPSPSSPQPMTLIPMSPFLDTLSFLCVAVLLPDWMGCLILFGYILLGSSRIVLSRCLTLLFRNVVPGQVPGQASNQVPGQVSGQAPGHLPAHPAHHISPLLLIPPVLTSLLLDTLILFAMLLLQSQLVNIVKIMLYSSILSILASFKTKATVNSILAGLTVIMVLFTYDVLVNALDLPVYSLPAFSQTALTINHIHYLRKSWRFTFKFSVEFISALFSIHICILNSPLTTFFPFNSYTIPLDELTYSINPMALDTGLPPTSVDSLLSVETPKIIAESPCPAFFNNGDSSSLYRPLVPAAFPQDQLLHIEDLSSTSSVVSQNFENYCVLPSSNKKILKKKASVRFSQPLWSILVALKTLVLYPTIYAGDDSSTALVQYRSYSNTDAQCFVFLVEETEIGLEVIGCPPSKEIYVRVNGVMWYQSETVRFKDSTLYVKISMLSPLSEYHVEILTDLGDGVKEYLADIIVSTTSNNPSHLQQPIRSSPLITLQQSLETTISNINREKLQLKKLKKDHQKALTAYKNDVTNRRKKLDNDKDEKIHRKIMSLRSTVSSLEHEYSKLNDELMDVLTKESEVHDKLVDNKREFDLRVREFDKIIKDYETEKSKIIEDLDTLKAELLSVKAKNDKLTNRHLKISEELQKVQSELQSLFEKDVTTRKSYLLQLQQERDTVCNQMALESSKLRKQLELLSVDNNILRKQANY